MEAGAKPRHLWERMEASGSVPPGTTAERGGQAKSEALLALQGRGVGCEKPDRRRSLRAGSLTVVAAADARPVALGRPPLSRVRGDVAGWERGAVS